MRKNSCGTTGRVRVAHNCVVYVFCLYYATNWAVGGIVQM